MLLFLLGSCKGGGPTVVGNSWPLISAIAGRPQAIGVER